MSCKSIFGRIRERNEIEGGEKSVGEKSDENGKRQEKDFGVHKNKINIKNEFRGVGEEESGT